MKGIRNSKIICQNLLFKEYFIWIIAFVQESIVDFFEDFEPIVQDVLPILKILEVGKLISLTEILIKE